MTHTVTLLADHKGYTKPRVNGDEYMVDALINITLAVAGGVTVTASSLGLSQITAVVITGKESLAGLAVAVCSATTGLYESSGSFKLAISGGQTGEIAPAADEGMVRVRAYGIL
jgi:predicted PP-loop superfamily ATPase